MVFKGFFDIRKSLIQIYFILFPLNKTAFERSESLFSWVQTWIEVNNIESLTPEVWFEEGDRIN